MKIELSLQRPHRVIDESIELRLVLVNDGDQPVRVPDPFHNDSWQPTYELRGPAWPDGHRWSARSATTPDVRPAPDDVPLALIELAPGQSHEGEIPLTQWCPIREPGRYTIEVSLRHEGVSAQSDPLTLTLVSLAARTPSVGADVGADAGAPGQLWMSFVHGAGEDSALFDAVWVEDRPDLGELSCHSLEHRRSVPAEVDEVHVPWSNADRIMAMASWRTWQQGDRLLADDSPLGQPFGLEVGAGAQVQPPVWQDDREVLDVLLRVERGRRLALARFTGGAAPEPPRGELVWRSELRPSIALARLALGPPGGGSLRRVVGLEAEDGNLSVTHFALGDDSGSAPTSVATFKNATRLPGAPMALRVTEQGHTQVWLLVATGGPGRWQIYLGRVEFDARGRHGGGTLDPLVTLPSTVVDSTVELPFAGPDLDQPVWALLTDRGQVLWSRGGKRRWHTIKRMDRSASAPQGISLGQASFLGGRRTVSPMQLRPLAQAAYLTVFDPGRSPRFITLGG